jgi:hypothetical protein
MPEKTINLELDSHRSEAPPANSGGLLNYKMNVENRNNQQITVPVPNQVNKEVILE